MKILTKNVTVGDYEFKVAIDRNIMADAFEQFPDLMEYLLKNSGKAKDDSEFLIEAIKNKNLHTVVQSGDDIKALVKYAFPKMLEKADKEYGTDNLSKADEILAYIEENEVDEIFSASMFEFICLGFTKETTEKKPKVKFTMV